MSSPARQVPPPAQKSRLVSMVMAPKKTTTPKAQPKKQPAKKAPAKKTTKKATSKTAPKKDAVKKSAAKKPAAAKKKPAAAKKATQNVNVRSSNGTYTTSTQTVAGDVAVTFTASPATQEAIKTITNTVVQMNDVKSKTLRKRMLAWFKRS